jgi:ABC-type multidrug transport system ATPase subunit
MGLDAPPARQARRLLIARALVHKPDVLFLDEPTAGLDPQTRVNLWDILKVLHDQGQTILLTTHYMEEAEGLCDRVAVVDHGRVLAEGSVDELKENAGVVTIVTVRFEEDIPPDFPERAGLTGQPGITSVETEGDQIRVFSREPEGLLGEVVAVGTREGLHVRDATQLKPSLETVFLTVHAAGQAPHVDVTNWGLLAVVLVVGATMTSSLGLLLGTMMDPRKMQMLC